MQPDTYLQRIGYPGSHTVSVDSLSRLIACHLQQIPFENLDFYGSPKELSLHPDDLYEKIVVRRRGGVCFELNGLFCRLLEKLGYDRYPVSVRVVIPHAPSAISHQGIVVTLDGAKYYCDVGFGGPGPKGLVCMEHSEVQNIGGEAFRVERKDIHFTILRQQEDRWIPTLRFADAASDDADFPILLYYFTTHPQSYFVRNRVVNLCLPDGYLALTGNHFTVCRGGQVRSQTLETEEAMHQVLREEFGLHL